jgi:ribonuclease R
LNDTGADGLVPIRTIGTEYFNYDETRHALIGTRSGAMHRLGDVVDVRLVEAQPIAGALRFELLSEGQTVPRSGRFPQGKRRAGTRPGRSPPETKRKPDKKSGKAKKGGKRGKSWRR